MVDFNKLNTATRAQAKINSMSEDALQAFIFKSCWNCLPQYRRQLFSVPNGGERHNGNKYKATGLISGIPDLIFYEKNTIVFFELKKPTGGKLSNNQQILKLIINKTGNPYFLIKGPSQFFYALIFTLMERKLITGKKAIELMKSLQDSEGLIFFGLTESQFEYEMRVFKFIFDMDLDQPENIQDLTLKETRGTFISSIKKFIHLEFDRSNGFQIVFKNDFSSFVKQEIF